MFRNFALSPAELRSVGSEVMTTEGTAHKAAVLLVCITASACWAWANYRAVNPLRGIVVILTCALAGSILVFVTVHRKQWASMLAPSYALLEGFILGDLSAAMDVRHHGIAANAVALTFAVSFSMLVVFRTGLIRVTDSFNRWLLVAMSGVGLFYLTTLMLSLTGVRVSIFAGGMASILASIVVVVLAAMRLLSDFDFIEKSAQGNLPKYMEWYAAFALILTLIWLYTEVLRLVSKGERAEGKA